MKNLNSLFKKSLTGTWKQAKLGMNGSSGELEYVDMSLDKLFPPGTKMIKKVK